MNEQETNKNNNNINNEKQEVLTPNQTGEIIQHEIETLKAEEKATEKVPAEEKPSEEIVEVSDEVGEDDKNVGEKSDTDTEEIVGKQEESESSNRDNNEVREEEKADELVENQEPVEEKNEEVQEQSIDEEDIEAIKKELAELKAEKEEAAKVKELVEVAQHVEAEYDRVVKGVNEALRETLEQYQIPTDKTIQELAKEDPAKAELARALIAQAKQALDFNTQQLSQTYKAKEQDVIFTKAERLFNKYEMSNEQAQVAADTFISILQASGLQDLDNDLAAKVELSVAQARFKVPVKAAKEARVVEPESREEIPLVESLNVEREPSPAPEKADEKESKVDVSDSVKELAKGDSESFKIERRVGVETPQKKVDLSGYKEGIEGSGKAAVKEIDTSNVLHKLAALPYKERQAFLKQNFALINKAMREINIKNSRDKK